MLRPTQAIGGSGMIEHLDELWEHVETEDLAIRNAGRVSEALHLTVEWHRVEGVEWERMDAGKETWREDQVHAVDKAISAVQQSAAQRDVKCALHSNSNRTH
jgi:hypothetical protein